MIVTRSGKPRELASGGFVIPTAACVPTRVGDDDSVEARGSNLLGAAKFGLPTNGDANFFASPEQALQ